MVRQSHTDTSPEGNFGLAGVPLHVPELVESTGFSWLETWGKPVFATRETGTVRTFPGLGQHIRTTFADWLLYVFDNHNHTPPCLYDAYRLGFLPASFTLVHIDQHSDLRENAHEFPHFREDVSLEKYFEASYFRSNVGNYLAPLLRNGTISQLVRIESESALLAFQAFASTPFVLDLDLDFFAPEMGIEYFDTVANSVRKIACASACTTIATSPYFLDQYRALGIFSRIFCERS